MQFQEITNRALIIRKKYEQKEIDKIGRSWSGVEQALGFVTDVGELAELVQAKEGIRDRDGNIDSQIAHELSDCMWSIMVLADRYDINLEQAFLNTMDELEARLTT